jgi:hypothetical protein
MKNLIAFYKQITSYQPPLFSLADTCLPFLERRKFGARINFNLTFVILALFFCQGALAQDKLEKMADRAIISLYQQLENNKQSTMAERLQKVAISFMNKPYIITPLGEGEEGKYDQFPLYRVDGFDCETFVDTVLAVAFAQNLRDFKHIINTIRYKNGIISYTNRNHFMSADWNPNNQKLGYIQEITPSIRDRNNQPIYSVARANIDKAAWYEYSTLEKIRLNMATTEFRRQRLEELKQEGRQFVVRNVAIPYISLNKLFSANGTPNMQVFHQIPHGSIIEIVRPNWQLKALIGTNLNVSHLGFVFWDENIPNFYQASSQYGKTLIVPLINYLSEARNSPTIKGINIQIITKEPLKLHNRFLRQ